MPAHIAGAQELQAGTITDRVICAADPSQSYALYVPGNYTASHTWPVIFAFDPGAHGRTPVDRYQAAAERYGYIVAASNNSRNGSTDFPTILSTMVDDVAARLAVDPKRVYLAGMSGGARTALGVALASKDIAGVMASSAGYPDNRVRTSLPFPVFATAGTEDFNHLEMRRLDRALASPHRLAIFAGGHVWLPGDLAMQAVEWMELHAMKRGLQPRDEEEIDRLLAARVASIDAGSRGLAAYRTFQGIADDFRGLRDVSEFARRAAELAKDKAVRAALDEERDEDKREELILRDINSLAAGLSSDDRRGSLSQLRQRWAELSAQAKNTTDSPERRMARRILSALSADGTKDEEYARIIAEYRVRRDGP